MTKNITVKGLEPATSCEKNCQQEPWETGSLICAQFMLQWFWFPEFCKFLFHLGKTPLFSSIDFGRTQWIDLNIQFLKGLPAPNRDDVISSHTSCFHSHKSLKFISLLLNSKYLFLSACLDCTCDILFANHLIDKNIETWIIWFQSIACWALKSLPNPFCVYCHSW